MKWKGEFNLRLVSQQTQPQIYLDTNEMNKRPKNQVKYSKPIKPMLNSMSLKPPTPNMRHKARFLPNTSMLSSDVKKKIVILPFKKFPPPPQRALSPYTCTKYEAKTNKENTFISKWKLVKPIQTKNGINYLGIHRTTTASNEYAQIYAAELMPSTSLRLFALNNFNF